MYRSKHLSLISKGLAPRSSKGFTLLELIIAMGVLSFAIAVVIYAFTASMHLFTNELSEGDTSIEIHRSLERMTNELRNALEIGSAGTTSITFWHQDTNSDGIMDAGETITYSWTGTSEGYINRIVQTSTQEIATGIKGFSFSYNDPANIRVVNIFITAQKGSVVSTLESSVKCRNL
ncbi:MAG: type II secretion system protein [bacterium]